MHAKGGEDELTQEGGVGWEWGVCHGLPSSRLVSLDLPRTVSVGSL